MLKSYEAILEGDRLKWTGQGPAANGSVRVQVTVIEEAVQEQDAPEERIRVKPDPELLSLLEHPPVIAEAERGRRMTEAIRKLRDLGTFAHIEDPVAWQREMRKDRPLPGRD